jgi:hypothetical protein
MTRRLEVLQWFGLLAGAAVWASQHLLGFGITQAECSPAGRRWGISNDVWQGMTMGVAAGVVACAGLAAAAVLISTREASYESEPPIGRIRFFAIAAIVANAIFLTIILLDGIASIVNASCRGS